VTVPLLGAAQGAPDDYVANQRDRVRLFGGAAATEPATHTRVGESAAELDAPSGSQYIGSFNGNGRLYGAVAHSVLHRC
jgi:Acyl-CoA dehydrogenase, C-terminal domain